MSRTLHVLSEGRDNNFNLIRMIAASAVLVSHAFPIALGAGAVEPLTDIAPANLGRLAVALFFAISGFFITKSFERRKSLVEFCTARFLRIYPALVVVIVLTTVVLGAVFTHLSVREYFGTRATWTYLPHNLSLFRWQWTLPGVFDTNPSGPGINGSLWTLTYEVGCYAMVMAVGILGLLKRSKFVLFLLFYAIFYVIERYYAGPKNLPLSLELSFPFVIGMAFYVFARGIPLHFLWAGALCIAAYLARDTIIFREVFILALVYATFCLAAINGASLKAYNRLGDYSYGLYIFAFPIQQMIVALVPGIGPMAMMLAAFVVATSCAVLSWHWIESPMLGQRHQLGRWLEAHAPLKFARGQQS